MLPEWAYTNCRPFPSQVQMGVWLDIHGPHGVWHMCTFMAVSLYSNRHLMSTDLWDQEVLLCYSRASEGRTAQSLNPQPETPRGLVSSLVKDIFEQRHLIWVSACTNWDFDFEVGFGFEIFTNTLFQCTTAGRNCVGQFHAYRSQPPTTWLVSLVMIKHEEKDSEGPVHQIRL